MPRQPRIDLPGVPQHIVQRGNRRQPTFFADADRLHMESPLRPVICYAERLGAHFATVLGSRHGTPFDAINASNACALAFVRGLPLPAENVLTIDPAHRLPTVAPAEFA